MHRTMMKSKIHRATVTDSNLGYEGSITIDEELMEKANIIPYEQVDIYNVTGGERFTTYAIKGEKNSGVICINGAAAHKAKKGDIIIIATYARFEEKELASFEPQKVYVNESNKIKALTGWPDRLSVAR
ncbi:aspartate 1-decarboxylase [Syntrophorhabdus aromaticivorans]|uniref:Aspartate 1-decarboxylase n=1 Tax=Syntrophorhabdus aromaticivorans TaxID=328301 RepID=A0A351U2M5_9BACT|nr:aspartate 1-decarboxylase [Syntrophorhabdus aromaticivorans]NLW36401.1 aspartate 1-decarboxylase [Syntrophorhabdus aromaticivorans]HBA54206.1 aspartate 1-decarboxylase [Syntrophorhabdus aromaticivorans]